MRKLYQTQWHGIQFNSFTICTTSKLADASFYALFYKKLFERYNNFADIDKNWLDGKLAVASFIQTVKNLPKDSKILSIGCGLGIIEKALKENGFMNLELSEVSIEPLKLVLPYFPAENIHIGFFPDCIPKNKLYDLIFLSSIEYNFTENEIINLLRSVKEHLTPDGICLLFSVSFEYKVNLTENIVRSIKDILKYMLEKIKIRNRGQFWGYIRTRTEFLKIMAESGFKQINDGLINNETYWIQGIKGK